MTHAPRTFLPMPLCTFYVLYLFEYRHPARPQIISPFHPVANEPAARPIANRFDTYTVLLCGPRHYLKPPTPLETCFYVLICFFTHACITPFPNLCSSAIQRAPSRSPHLHGSGPMRMSSRYVFARASDRSIPLLLIGFCRGPRFSHEPYLITPNNTHFSPSPSPI